MWTRTPHNVKTVTSHLKNTLLVALLTIIRGPSVSAGEDVFGKRKVRLKCVLFTLLNNSEDAKSDKKNREEDPRAANPAAQSTKLLLPLYEVYWSGFCNEMYKLYSLYTLYGHLVLVYGIL